MGKNITFRAALVISCSIHLLFLSPWGALRFHRPKQEEPQIEVTYIVQEIDKEKIEKVIENLPRKYELEKKEIKESEKQAPASLNPEPEAKIAEKKDEYMEEKKVRELEEYIAYYELIRQKIKGRVTALYKRPGEEGRVGVAFILDRRGAIKKFEIEDISGSDKRYLEKIASQAVRSAAPFPPFPEELRKPELTFTVAIIFTRDR